MFRWWVAAALACLSLTAPADVLHVGFGTHKPPYIYEGERRGLEYELIERAAQNAGFEVTVYYAPMERLHLMLRRGEIDAIATTHQRSGVKAYYSQTYIYYHNVAVALARRGYRIEHIADLGSATVHDDRPVGVKSHQPPVLNRLQELDAHHDPGQPPKGVPVSHRAQAAQTPGPRVDLARRKVGRRGNRRPGIGEQPRVRREWPDPGLVEVDRGCRGAHIGYDPYAAVLAALMRSDEAGPFPHASGARRPPRGP